MQLPPPPVAVEPEKPWDVATVMPGSWNYRQDATGSIAAFGFPNGAPALTLRCTAPRREIEMLIPGSNTPATVTLRTSAGNLAWPGGPSLDGSVTLRIARGASDNGLDWIAFSRGRMSVEVPGRPRLLVPVWAEVSRVIEDCRR